ncbi:Methyltransferase-like protein 13 [Hondaea fermentalgiana]|uniref:Methyltransferase-like protein 13 n=1 Tax=Hondaea fermentalgiana TaxID=2315210 RepID=A0A2R5GR36_9STRA|nr:Methyltransferase-like protein 13 [Hondaea fermentalgiana]|eukprot:GBG33347.1 Methyltransferase-like protein 13 [Hondaea fermentalgiana]
MLRGRAHEHARRVARAARSRGLSSSTRDFGSPAFWDAKYRSGRAPREWFAGADGVVGAVEAALRQEPGLSVLESVACLHVGCGLSELGFRTAQLFPHVHVTNVDTSAAAVEGLQSQGAAKYEPEVLARSKFVQDDVLDSKLASETFDLCIDKGTLDAVEFAGDAEVGRFLQGIHRLLRPGGLYLQVSTVDPGVRDAVTLADVPWARVTWTNWTSDSLAEGASEESDLDLWIYKFTKSVVHV